ncbi:hypothetical protein HanRHA438_Chr02g0057591 [Helianthus annuus]|nr:hypothetical protein HanRHA438_Chr02g0057591 [Helianthus annuus]
MHRSKSRLGVVLSCHCFLMKFLMVLLTLRYRGERLVIRYGQLVRRFAPSGAPCSFLGYFKCTGAGSGSGKLETDCECG